VDEVRVKNRCTALRPTFGALQFSSVALLADLTLMTAIETARTETIIAVAAEP